MAATDGPVTWKDDASRERYYALLREQRADGWRQLADAGRPLPAERDVATTAGPTRAFHWRGSGAPLVLVHGAQTNSIMWAPLIAALTDRDVVALDVPGDPGESELRVALTDPSELGTWLQEATDALELEPFDVVGASYGGWTAVQYANRPSARLRSLVLVEPILDPLRAMFFVHGIASGVVLALVPPPAKAPLARRLDVASLTDASVRKMAMIPFRKHDRRSLPRYVPVTDEQLALDVPLLVLLGARSSVHRSRTLAERIGRVAPGATVHVVEHAGHTLPVEHPDDVAARIAAFLASAVDGHAPS